MYNIDLGGIKMVRCKDCKNMGAAVLTDLNMVFDNTHMRGYGAAINLCREISSNPDIPFVVESLCERNCSKFVPKSGA